MKLPRLRKLLLALLLLFAFAYVAGAVALAMRDDSIAVLQPEPDRQLAIAIFGASGTAGDGILQASLADPDVKTIHVITRRATSRIEEGIEAGKVRMTLHTDYLDYSSVHDEIADVDAVFWAIGLSSIGVDEETYSRIHVDFPAQFLREWLRVSKRADGSFHYISSSDISEHARSMWAREKYRAEQVLTELAADTKLRVVLYRPDYIGPTAAEAHFGQTLMYWFFAPVGAALKARQIGEAMLEASVRGDELENGKRLSTRSIIVYSDAYKKHLAGNTQ